MAGRRGIVGEGWSLMWRRPRALGWLFAANFLLAFFSAGPSWIKLRGILDHTYAAQRLYRGFDVSTLIELLSNPGISLTSALQVSTMANAIFFLLTLFVTGGILESYRLDRTLTTGQFFLACGHFFWRWVRLLILLTVVLIPIVLAGSGLSAFSGKLSDESSYEQLGFWVRVGGMVALLFLAMYIRLWFDLVQIRTVAEDSPGILRSAALSKRLLLSNFAPLFWMYLRISLVSWIALALGVWMWIRLIPAQDVLLSWTLLEVVLFIWLMTRWWQRASETVWYQQHEAGQVPNSVA